MNETCIVEDVEQLSRSLADPAAYVHSQAVHANNIRKRCLITFDYYLPAGGGGVSRGGSS